MKKTIIVSIIVGVAIVGSYFFPLSKTVIQQFGTTSQGGTSDTAKQASIAVVLSAPGANATSSSIFNGSGNDRYVTAVKAGCETVGTSLTAYTGAGLAKLLLSVGTTTTSAPTTIPTNLIGGGSITIATTTAFFTIASSTAVGLSSTSGVPGVTDTSEIWASGSYMTFWLNATNTAQCTVGVDYFSS